MQEIVDAIAIQEDEIIRARNEIIRCKKHCGFSGNLTEVFFLDLFGQTVFCIFFLLILIVSIPPIFLNLHST